MTDYTRLKEPEETGQIIRHLDDDQDIHIVPVWRNVQVIVGAPGSGKTVLAVHLARLHSNAQFYCKGRSCMKDGCKEPWIVVSNLNSLVLATSLKEAYHDRSLIANKHILLLVDAMGGLDFQKSVTKRMSSWLLGLIQQLGVKTYVTIPAMSNNPKAVLQPLDARVREQVVRVMDTWNPKGNGSVVHAIISATRNLTAPIGTLPPWERTFEFPHDAYRVFDTSATLKMFDTLEKPGIS